MSPAFSICCAHDKVILSRLIEPPPYLLNLYTSSESDAISFRKNIRCYNNVLACTSFGANIEKFQGRGVSNFRIHGQVYHRIGPCYQMKVSHQDSLSYIFMTLSMRMKTDITLCRKWMITFYRIC